MVLLIGFATEQTGEFNSFEGAQRLEKVVAAQMSTSEEKVYDSAPVQFLTVVDKALRKRKERIEVVCPANDPVAKRILQDYGAIFIASRKVLPPPVCVFQSEEQVMDFQNKAGVSAMMMGEDQIELQPAAMKGLVEARDEALKQGLNITPRDGPEAGRRTYEDTRGLWFTRVLPALEYWQERGRISREQSARLRSLPTHQQVVEVLQLEAEGIFFSKDLSKPILYSVAAPGTSQHLSMLAFDINEFDDEKVRRILASHGWFQTVLGDLPHFTFLGLKEKELPAHGLRPVFSADQLFWIPNIASETLSS